MANASAEKIFVPVQAEHKASLCHCEACILGRSNLSVAILDCFASILRPQGATEDRSLAMTKSHFFRERLQDFLLLFFGLTDKINKTLGT